MLPLPVSLPVDRSHKPQSNPPEAPLFGTPSPAADPCTSPTPYSVVWSQTQWSPVPGTTVDTAPLSRPQPLPALVVFGWEGIHFLLPPFLKQISVIHYLQSLCPVPVPEGPLATLADAPAPWVAVLGLLALATVLVAISAWRIRGMEIAYDES